MIKGITIKLLQKKQTGVDDFNRPIYEETPVTIENVLVGQPSTDDITGANVMYGKKVAYTIAVPKGDNNKWNGNRVELPEPFAGIYSVIGFPTAGIETNIPLFWNKKVLLERIQG